MNTSLRHLLIALALVLGASTVLALPSDEIQPARLRFLFLDESPGAYSAQVNHRQLRLSSGPYVISAPLVPPDLQPLAIFKELPDAQTGAPAPVHVATVTPPTGIASALVIISPRSSADPVTRPAYAVEVVDCDIKTFPAGSIGIINRAQTSMAAQFGDQQALARPGETRIIRPTTDSRHRVFSRIAMQTTDGWKRIADTISIVRPQERVIGIFVYSPSGMRNTYTADEIDEFGPPKPGNFWLTFSDQP